MVSPIRRVQQLTRHYIGLGKAVTFFGKTPKKAAIFTKPMSATLKKMIKSINIEDPISSHTTRAIEVVLEMDDETKRWCFFITPEGASQCGDFIEGTEIRVHCGASHMFIVSNISKEIIEKAIKHVEKNGELLKCTLPL